MQQEVKIALEGGFRVHKFKRRAHTDVVEQVQAIAEVAPEDYELTIDANTTFGTVERTISFGRRLKEYPHVKCLESPIVQDDVEGYLRIKKELGLPTSNPLWFTVTNDFASLRPPTTITWWVDGSLAFYDVPTSPPLRTSRSGSRWVLQVSPRSLWCISPPPSQMRR